MAREKNQELDMSYCKMLRKEKLYPQALHILNEQLLNEKINNIRIKIMNAYWEKEKRVEKVHHSYTSYATSLSEYQYF